ncbi:MAG: CAP domain-containing protein [Oscillospiraceae bacterium]|nr:CAP domain-containing protein [Oscillospiraceae bacterium]
MRKNMLSKIVGCAVALAVVVPVVSIPLSASCPLTDFLYNYIGNNAKTNGGNSVLNSVNNSNTCNSGNGSCNSAQGTSCNSGNSQASVNNNSLQSLLNGLFQNNSGLNYNNSNSNTGKSCNSADGCKTGNCPANQSCASGSCSANQACTSGNCAADNKALPPASGVCEGPGCGSTHVSGECSSYAEAVLDLVNAERKKAGVRSLQLDGNLCKAAEVRSAEIITKFSHTRPNGKSWSTAVEGRYNSLGENIAAGYKTPQEVVKGWMSSPGHRENILNPNFTKMGVGYAESNGMYCCYWTQIFAS